MPTLLVIDDSAADRAELRQAARPSGLFDRVIEAESGLQGLKLLLSERVDLVLCDLEMPGFDGEKLLHIKQASPASRDIPFLFVTATTDRDRNAQLLGLGACDLITKPFHPPELAARLKLHLETKRLHDELRLKTETMARLNSTDSVTGLRTRRYAFDTLTIEVLRARRYGSPLSIMMADLDHFKQVNDVYGHLGGDVTLRGVAKGLLDQIRSTDVAGRYGGEEIIVILAQNDLEGAVVLAERWRMAVEDAVFQAQDGREIRVTISIGVAGFHPGMRSADDLISVADEMLYRAKASGRNQVVATE